jgi:HEAT repeat protein
LAVDRIDILVLIFLGGAAAVYILASTIGLLLRREFERRSLIRGSDRYKHYTRRMAALVLRELPPLGENVHPAAIRNYYRSFLDPLKKELSMLSSRERRAHRLALRSVMMDFAQDLSGEAYDRLVYFAEELGVVSELMSQIKKRDWWLRATAARHLGLIRAFDASDVLIDLLRDKAPAVRQQAAVALLLILGVKALKPIFWMKETLSPWDRVELSVVISGFGGEAVPYLLEALKSNNKSIVVLAIEMLGSLGFTTALEPLLEIATHHNSPRLRAQAVGALGEISDQRAVEPLVELCRSSSPPMRIPILRSFGAIGSPEAIPQLLESLRRGGIDEQIVAALALGRCGVEGERQLRALSESVEPPLRRVAFNALEELGFTS